MACLRCFLFLALVLALAQAAPLHQPPSSSNTVLRSLTAHLYGILGIPSTLDIKWTTLRGLQSTSSERSPCRRDNEACLSAYGTRIVNELRAGARGNAAACNSVVKPDDRDDGQFLGGTEEMLEVALEHSWRMSIVDKLWHQELALVPLGCGMPHISAENVAYETVTENEDPVRKCIDRFTESQPHLENMLGPYSRVALGVVIVEGKGKFDKVWCTQVFGNCTAASPAVALEHNCEAVEGTR